MTTQTACASGTATVQEIFSGIQGEGILVGVRQVFLRLYGCGLHCRYCDTPASRGMPPMFCRVERAAGSREIAMPPNPLTVAEVLAAVARLQAGFPHHSLSLTGGEPLHWRAFLDALLPALPALGLPSYLETNGTLAEEMAALALPPDYIAMDIKLPSVTGEAGLWAPHTAFLAAAVRRLGAADLCRRLQVKIVFGEESLEDIAHAAELIAAYRRDLPCVLQPVTPRGDGPAAPSPQTVLEAQRLAAAVLSDVRVIPQTHVQLGQW